MNIFTGKITWTGSEEVTEPCAVPLFGDNTKTGICRACREGWETEGNIFANEEERTRATQTQVIE